MRVVEKSGRVGGAEREKEGEGKVRERGGGIYIMEKRRRRRGGEGGSLTE